MSRDISIISSVRPFASLENIRAIGRQPAVSNVSNESLSEIVAKYKQIFGDKSCQQSYAYLESCILIALGRSIDQGAKYDNDFAKLSEIYSDIRKIHGKFIDEICREGYMALQFYAKSVVGRLEALHSHIQKAQAALKALEDVVNADGSEYEKNQKARQYVDKLFVFEDFSREETNALMRFHQFNNDTKQWEIIAFTDETKERIQQLFLNSPLKTYNEYVAGDGTVNKLEYLRNTPIKYKDSRESSGEKTAPIQVFGSLNMVDRLKFIWFYYKLIIAGGDNRYAVFPGDHETGFPCLPNIKSADVTKPTKNLGAMEMFYVGYLTDRDGPINAVSSFFEVKVRALRDNLTIQSKSISALNTYLEFINRGLNVLNGSQSGAKDKDAQKRIPDGAMLALTYLCGGNMYNLVEARDKTKCLVIEDSQNKGKYMLVSADNAGMNFMLGSRGDIGSQRGNSFSTNERNKGEWRAANFTFAEMPTNYHFSTTASNVDRHNDIIKDFGNTFLLPTKIDCANVIPSSVRQYDKFWDYTKITTDVVSSWTQAFSNKTQFINTAIDTINADIQVDRSKIDSFDSICSTFRSRAHEAHSNTAANVR